MKKIAAAVCAAALALSMTGCADTSWAVKYDKITIPVGVYNFFLVNNAYSVSSMASSGSSDVWSQTVSNTSAVTWAMNSALDSCKQVAVIEKLAADNKVKLAASEKSYMTNYASSTYNQSSGVLSKNGISQDSMERIYEDMYYLRTDVFKAIYGKGGSKAVSNSDIDKYLSKNNFVHVKQIFVSKKDTSSQSGAAYTGTKLAAQKAKADEAYKAAKADPKKFANYVKKYNEDPGMMSYPVGYTFNKTTGSNYDPKFVKLAYSLKIGEVGMAESDMGYFIEYKEPATAANVSTNDSESILQAMKGTEFSNTINSMIKKGKFEQNNAAFDKFSPKKVDLTASS